MRSAAGQRAGEPGSIRLRDLTETQRRLVELMRRVGFGEICGLTVLDGQPSFDPAPRVLRKILIGGENRDRIDVADFALKRQVIELLEHLAHLGSGTADIEVQHGVPFRLIVEDQGR